MDCHQALPVLRSLFSGVDGVPPGCQLIARDGHVEIHRYRQPEYPHREMLAADARSDAEVVSGFRVVLDNAVAARLRATSKLVRT
jgi:asparagine synthase (glutamine-hydrolysing)